MAEMKPCDSAIPGRYRMPDEIFALVLAACARNDVPIAELLQGARHLRVTRARRAICCELSRRGYSLSQIGRWLRVHHTSVFYALRSQGRAARAAAPRGPVPCPDLSGEWAI